MKESKKMKKIVAFILAGLMILTLVACNTVPSDDKGNNDNGSETEGNVAPETTEKDVSANASLEAIATALINKYGEYAGLRAQYDEYMASIQDDEYATEEDKNMTYETFASYQLNVLPVEKDAEWLMGFNEIPTGYSECYNYVPSSMNPFMGYVFRVEEGTDIEAFKKSLTETCDLRWMICREANTVICESFGDIVLFQMCVVISDEMPDGFTAEQKDGFVETFYTAVKTPADAE